MKQNELRTGNFLEYNGVVCEVDSINSPAPRKEVRFTHTTVITLWNNGLFDVSIDECKPVPLTEEWLIKFGFDHREFSLDKGCFFLMKRKGKSGYLYQSHTRRFQVKFVHQLQNLYFANMEEELAIKNEH